MTNKKLTKKQIEDYLLEQARNIDYEEKLEEIREMHLLEERGPKEDEADEEINEEDDE